MHIDINEITNETIKLDKTLESIKYEMDIAEGIMRYLNEQLSIGSKE